MSDYKKNNKWDVIFDCLYYNYINANIKILKKDYSLRFQINIWKSKSLEEKNKIITIANNYINSLYN